MVKPRRPTHSRNLLLAALPPADYARLQPLLTEVPLKLRQVLHAGGERIDAVYFPLEGLCSVVTAMEDGRMVEVAAVGNEGVTAVPVIFGGRQASADVIVRLPGTVAAMMPLDAFLPEIERRGALFEAAARYANMLLTSVMQSAACSALHTTEQRYARWLLHTGDRTGTDSVPVTQEFLGAMLGVRRATITGVAREFQHAGLVNLERRRVTIVDRSGLEAAACECHRVIRDQVDRLIS